MRKLFFLIVMMTCVKLFSQTGWTQQPKLVLDHKKNIKYLDNITNTEKTIFPVMLYSFPEWSEADPLSSSSFWNQAEQWGFNMIYSWDRPNDTKNVFLNNCNSFKKIGMLSTGHYNQNMGIFSFPDEPNGASGFTHADFVNFRNNWNNKELGYVNFDVSPYFYRKLNGAADGFDSQLPCGWCNNNNGNSSSYTDYASVSDIISFDFYPFRPDGTLGNNVIGNYGNTSVGEFTKLLKNKYPDKAVWAVIQTLWYDPWYLPFDNNVINETIIRQLTFDSIINGVDGVSFWGHGQTHEHKNTPDLSFLNDYEDLIWKHTLYQTKELQELQENYDQILLEDNLKDSYVKNGKTQYCFKKAKNSNKYYLFIVNSGNQAITTKIDIPKGLKISEGSLQSIGNYQMPAIPGIAPATNMDYRNPNAIGNISRNGKLFYTNLEKYGTNIISMELIPESFDDDIAMLYNYPDGTFKIHNVNSDGNGNSGFTFSWADYNGQLKSNSVFQTVSGDFNNDANDDIAMLYNNPDGTFKIHLTTSDTNGNSGFISNWADYSGQLTSGSVFQTVSGDFNNDGNDDIAMLYNYADGTFKIHLVTSDGNGNSKFIPNWADYSGQLTSDSVFKTVSGDFNNDGHDDIAMLYNYADGTFKIHLVTSDGNGNSGYIPSWADYSGQLTSDSVFKTVSGDFNNDGHDDIAMLYNYADGTFKIHLVTSDGNGSSAYIPSWADYSGQLTSDSVFQTASGDFNNDGHDDIAMLYNYADGTFKIHLVTSNGNGGSGFTLGWADYSGQLTSGSVFQTVSGDFNKFSASKVNKMLTPDKRVTTYKVTSFPNPFDKQTNIRVDLKKSSFIELKIFNSLGQEVTSFDRKFAETGVHDFKFDGSNLPGGVYYYKIKINESVQTNKLILIK